MKVIVMGCGRVGSQVSLLLTADGHDVTVIDHNEPNAAGRLGKNFKGRLLKGIGFDRNVLLEAGIEYVDAFVSASPSDNANILAARIARNFFHVPRVIARLYDPLRADIYHRLGLATISTTNWGAERIYEMVTHTDLDVIHSFGRGESALMNVELPHHLIGRTVRELSIPGMVLVVSITRDDKAFIPSDGTEFRNGDLLHLVVASTAMERVEELLGL